MSVRAARAAPMIQSVCFPRQVTAAARSANLVGGIEAKTRAKPTQSQINGNIVPLMRDEEAGHAALLNEVGEPCNVGVASEVSGFAVAGPKAGDKKRGEKEKRGRPVFAKKIYCVSSLRWLLRHACSFEF